MIDRKQPLALTHQAKVLRLSRGSPYSPACFVSELDFRLMRKIDKIHIQSPFAGARMLRDLLRLDGKKIGRKHVATLMKKMGIEAFYRKPNTSRRSPKHRIYLYLLSRLEVNHPYQVWAMDITYLPMARGFIYLVAVVDGYSRKVLSWRLSNTIACLESVNEAIARYGVPEIVNTDQDSQFTKSSLASSRRTISRSARMAREVGEAMSLWSGCGEPLSMRRSISEPINQ